MSYASERPDGSRRSAVLGAVAIMATSAIGPGFITQTAGFTNQLGAAFACAIVLSVVVDIAVQLNVWRIIGVAGLRAHELANHVLPGAGHVLAALVVIGGLVFNVGNVSGCGLGLDAMLGVDPKIGGSVSAVLAIAIFLSRRAGAALDRAVIGLGLVMLIATLTMAVVSRPPLGAALRSVVAPKTFDVVAVMTIIGGTIGGYITYAGAHRIVDSGRAGVEHIAEITRGSVVGILLTGLMRALLFLAVLGVVTGGAKLNMNDPAGSAFQAAAGRIGLAVYGLILFSAALSSVIGAAYTSVSFLTTQRTSERARVLLTAGAIALTAVVYLAIQEPPVTLLILAGTVNGLILPVGVGLLLWIAWRRSDLLHGYRYPKGLLAVGVLAWLLTLYLGYRAIVGLAALS